MQNPLSNLPWFVAGPAFLAFVVAAGFVTNALGADYFKRSSLEEASPLSPQEAIQARPTATAGASSATVQPAAAQPRVLASGDFRDGAPGHHGSGTATIGHDASGTAVLVLEGFSVTNGPNLHVILSTEAAGGGEGIDLGKLKATDGTFSYEIPPGVTLSEYRSVTIWCASFPTIFAYATLEA